MYILLARMHKIHIIDASQSLILVLMPQFLLWRHYFRHIAGAMLLLPGTGQTRPHKKLLKAKTSNQSAITEDDNQPHQFWNRYDTALDDKAKLAAHIQAENFAYRSVFGEMRDLATMGFPKALSKSVVLAVLRINPHETLPTYEAAILFGISQRTLSKRLAGQTHYRGVNIGK